jgi:hypothetical protein
MTEYSETPPVEATAGPGTGPLDAEPAYEQPSEEAAAYQAEGQVSQPQPAYLVQTHEATEPAVVETQPLSQPMQSEPTESPSQPEVISFSELFAWQGSDDTSASAGGTNPAPTEEPAQQQVEGGQEVYGQPEPSW